MQIQFSYMSDEEVYTFLSNKKKKIAKLAFEELYARYSTKIYSYCKKILMNDESTNDTFQETFTRIIEASKSGKKMTNFAGFIITIARNLCLNERENIRNTMVYIEDFHLPSTNFNDDKELVEIVRVALDNLPIEFRECLILKEFLNYSYAEIAEITGTNLSLVRIRIHRAKERIKEILSPYSKEIGFLLENDV